MTQKVLGYIISFQFFYLNGPREWKVDKILVSGNTMVLKLDGN